MSHPLRQAYTAGGANTVVTYRMRGISRGRRRVRRASDFPGCVCRDCCAYKSQQLCRYVALHVCAHLQRRRLDRQDLVCLA